MAKSMYVKKVQVPSLGELPIMEGGATFRPSSIEREHQRSEVAEFGGFTEQNAPAEVELTLRADSALDLQQINAVEKENITITVAGGQVHVMPNAWCATTVELTKGEVAVTFTANISERIS